MKKSLYSAIFLALLASASVATAQIQMTFTSVQPTCHGYTNGSATVFAVGGTGGYTYLWSNGQTTQSAFGIGVGTYTVTVTDAALNTASGSTTLLEPSAVTVAITASNLSCDGASGTLTATGFGGTPPYSYAWDGPNSSASESVTVTAPGNYFVTVSDANGCAGVESFTVASPLSIEVVATDIPCSIYLNGGAVNAIVTGGVTPYTFSWSNGGTTQLVTGVGAGPHIGTVTSANGCVAVDSDFVNIPPPLEIEVIWLSPACGGNNNGSVIVEASGGTPPYTYTWTPGPLSGPSQSGLAPGQYYVCTFDSNLCQVDLWIEILATTGLDVQLVVTSATCIGIDNATATAVVSPPGSGFIYEWTIITPDSVVTDTTGVIQLTDLAAGTNVSVTVTDPVSGCSGTATGIVGAHTDIDVAVTDVDILCAGGLGSATAVASNGTPQYTYTWFSNGVQIGDTSSISGLNAGAYMVSVVDSLGCEAIAVADIGIASAPNALIDGGHVLICGDSLSTVQFINASTDPYNSITSLVWTVTGPSINTVIIDQNQIVFQLPVDETILVQLIATSGLGCSDTTSLEYNVPGYPDFTLSLDSTSINCVSDSVRIDVIGGDSTYTYVWDPAVTFNPNPLHVLVGPTVTTTYVLTATDGNACTASASITIAPLDSLFQLFVSDTLIRTCSDSVTLTATTTIPATIIWVFEGDIAYSGNTITVPATSTTGIYTVTAITSDSCILKQEISVTGYGIEVSLDSNAVLTICEGDSLPLSVLVTPFNDSLTYLWSVNAPAILISPMSANPIITGPAGIYTVTVIVTNVICSDTLSFQIEILPGFNLEGQITADLCKGLEVSFFNESGIGGSWDFGDSTPSIEFNPIHLYNLPGQYQVVFSPNLQCTPAWDSMITVFADTLAAGITHTYVDCSLQAIIQFQDTVNHPGIKSWAWTFSNGLPATSSDTIPIITYIEEGTYIATLVVTDINHCTATATDSVEVVIVSDSFGEGMEICKGDSISLNPIGIDSNATYVWTSVPFDSSLVDVNNPNPTVSPLVPTVYSVQISQGLLCSEAYSLAVDFKPGSTVDLPNDTIVCSTDSLSITAQSNGAWGFEWSNSLTFSNIFATTQTVEVLPFGTYYVRTTGTECFDVDSVTIDLKMPEIQAIPSDNDICLGEETALLLTNLIPDQNLEFVWVPSLPNVPNPIVSPTETTIYTVTATNQFGCTTTLSYTVNVTNVSVDAETSQDTLSFTNPTTTLVAIPGGNGIVISYSWSPAGTLSNPNSPETEATPTETTTYTVTVTTSDGCVAIDTVTVYFRSSPCVSPFVFIPKAFTPNHDQKNDIFKVNADGMTALKLIIWNRWGEIVYETNDPNDPGWDGTYKGKELTPDSYAWYVWLTCGNGDIFESKGNVTLLK
ncbi:MAG: gliding motility-associated C-terminal domain-containing protein [Saprospiraceae bacterium]|nr:gliding motility-associated C-terminal domain-containing protein [Saprospiraceae bacterium]